MCGCQGAPGAALLDRVRWRCGPRVSEFQYIAYTDCFNDIGCVVEEQGAPGTACLDHGQWRCGPRVSGR